MTLFPGEILNNRYKIVKLLGQGGFGAVYLSWDMTFELPCAVKENSESSDGAQRQFLLEAKILHTLRHPNLPMVKDYFLIQGQGQYLVMDYIDGQDLQEILLHRGKPLLETQVIPWILQVCKALEYLHSQQPPVIHRDIKPANIKITPEGKAVLVDFGLSKILDPNQLTNSGARGRGTPGYSPPEQYGQGTTDPRSDVYALGATLYHCLTGIIPPDSVDILSSVMSAPTPVHRLNMTVTVRTGSSVEKAMQVRKEIRWGSVREFRVALTPNSTITPLPLRWIGNPVSDEESVVSGLGNTYSIPVKQASNIPTVPPTQVIADPTNKPNLKDVVDRNSKIKYGFSRKVVASGIVVGIALIAVLFFSLSQLTYPLFALQQSNRLNGKVLTLSSSDLTLGAKEYLLTQTMATKFIESSTNSTTQTAWVMQTQLIQSFSTKTAVSVAVLRDIPKVMIAESEFNMGSESGNSDELPVHAVYIDTFSIDVYEVTNSLYLECVDTGNCDSPHDPVYFFDPKYARHPVVNLDWYQAQEYCVWRGGSLPTEAQWEKAARGGLEKAIYPWGDDPPICLKGVPNGAQFGKCGSTMEVGYFSPNGYGLYDTAGNVWEWVWDWYSESFYSISEFQNPNGPASGQTRVLRGGSWYFLEYDLRVSNRLRRDPSMGYNIVGFRCVYQP